MMTTSFKNQPFCIEWLLERVDGAKMLGLKKTQRWDVSNVKNQQLSIHNEVRNHMPTGMFWSLFVSAHLADTSTQSDLSIQCLQYLQSVLLAKQTNDLGVANTIYYQMTYRNSCIFFTYLDFGLINDENCVDMAVSCESILVICKILQQIFAKFPKYASVILKYFQHGYGNERNGRTQSGNCKFDNTTFSQMNLFEATANRLLISSTRQDSNKVWHMKFA